VNADIRAAAAAHIERRGRQKTDAQE
jgi:hypothetical protein